MILMIFVTAQVALLVKGGSCGVLAKPPYHTPLFPLTQSSY